MPRKSFHRSQQTGAVTGDNLHVIILGAGTTGLLIAQGLKKNGIPFSIHERENADTYWSRHRDWSMSLARDVDSIKNTLPEQLRARFDEIRSDPHDHPGPDRDDWLPLYNGQSAELIVKIPGGTASRVSRLKMRKLFSEGVDIQFDKAATKIEENDAGVTVHFRNGAFVSGTTVVCCDGIQGVGREILLGWEKAALSVAPCTVVNICQKYTAEQARFIRGTLDPVAKFAIHPEHPYLFLVTLVDVPNLEHPEDWKIQCLFTVWGDAQHPKPNKERLRQFRERASTFAEPWRSAVLWLPDDTDIPPDRIRYWKDPVLWPNWNGKATLAGDAAHPMMPFRAQGLNNCMEDAGRYVNAILAVKGHEKSLSHAITEYGSEVFERGSQEIKISSQWGLLMHHWESLSSTPMLRVGYGKANFFADCHSTTPEERVKEAPAVQPHPGEMTSRSRSQEQVAVLEPAHSSENAGRHSASSQRTETGDKDSRPNVDGHAIVNTSDNTDSLTNGHTNGHANGGYSHARDHSGREDDGPFAFGGVPDGRIQFAEMMEGTNTPHSGGHSSYRTPEPSLDDMRQHVPSGEIFLSHDGRWTREAASPLALELACMDLRRENEALRAQNSELRSKLRAFFDLLGDFTIGSRA